VKAAKPPKLVLISEWGQELEAHRHLVCEVLRECCGAPNVCPATLGLRVQLPQAAIRCDAKRGSRDRCGKPATKWGYDPSNQGFLCFRCDDPYHGSVNDRVPIRAA